MIFFYITLSNRLVLILFIGIVLLVPKYVLAHATGESLEKTVGEYVVDIGYNPTIIEVGSPIVLDFNLLLSETGENVLFTDIWARIVKQNKTVFASGIHKPTFGGTTMVYTFPEAGEYELMLRFQEEGNKIVEASFPLTVESMPGAGPNPFPWVLLGVLAGAVAGFLLGFGIKNKV